MRPPGRFFRFPPQYLVEDDVETVAGLAVKERPRWNRDGEHLLQADRLGTKLNLIAIVCLGLAPLVLHGEGEPGAIRQAVELHDVGLADQSKPKRPQRYAIFDPNVAPRFPAFIMYALVHNPAFGGAPALRPCLFDVDEGALTGTKNHVLQGRKLNQVFWAVHIVTCYLIYCPYLLLLPDSLFS